jgi:hypothetical protein
MMETKFFLNRNRFAKWFFGVVLMLGLFVTNSVNAQLVVADPARDSSLANTEYVTREQVLLMESTVEGSGVQFLAEEHYEITDLANATFDDFIHATPDQNFFSIQEFYDYLTPAKKMGALQNPDKVKIYKPRQL